MFNREDITREPKVLKTYKVSRNFYQLDNYKQIQNRLKDTTEVHLYSYQNTLVVLERQAVENMLTSIINITNFKLSLWNALTLGKQAVIKQVWFCQVSYKPNFQNL